MIQILLWGLAAYFVVFVMNEVWRRWDYVMRLWMPIWRRIKSTTRALIHSTAE